MWLHRRRDPHDLPCLKSFFATQPNPAKTTIVGNFRFDYEGKKVDLSEVSWLKRLFQAAHTKMDHDPEVWALAEKLILDVISAKQLGHSAASTSPGAPDMP